MESEILINAIEGVLDLAKRSGKELGDLVDILNLDEQLNKIDLDYLNDLNEVSGGVLLYYVHNRPRIRSIYRDSSWLDFFSHLLDNIEIRDTLIHVSLSSLGIKSVYSLYVKEAESVRLDFYIVDRASLSIKGKLKRSSFIGATSHKSHETNLVEASRISRLNNDLFKPASFGSCNRKKRNSRYTEFDLTWQNFLENRCFYETENRGE